MTISGISIVADFSKLNLQDYDYLLPESRIAQFPLKKRDQSNLLLYKDNQISHHKFFQIPELLPEKSLLVFNETRVLPARFKFLKSTGAVIEIFLLHPVLPSPVIPVAMKSHNKVIWHCLVKNFKKWKNDQVLLNQIKTGDTDFYLKAMIYDRDKNLILFSWDQKHLTFGDIINITGNVPLPPYMKRDPIDEDKYRYQTVYSKNQGAVAAPTAGLHFTEKILKKLKTKGYETDYLTLHVSAGTFQPIRQKDISKHPMHMEQISFTRNNIHKLLDHKGPVLAVGTTSMRTLESMYWFGVKLLLEKASDLYIETLYPYTFDHKNLPSAKESLQAILHHMSDLEINEIYGETQIFIFPGYDFYICNGLITNFHMPKSTLILLVAALIGDNWKNIYQSAMEKGYRFLSYGDSSLLLP